MENHEQIELFDTREQASLPLGVLGVVCRSETEHNKVPLKESAERVLLDEIRRIIGPSAMKKNGGGWRVRIRHHRKAVLYAIEDWKLRTPQQRAKVRQRDAWLAYHFFKAKKEIAQVWSQTA